MQKYHQFHWGRAEVLACMAFAVQMITVPDHHFRQLAKGTDWIRISSRLAVRRRPCERGHP